MTTRCVAFSPGIAHARALGRDANDPARTPSRAVGLRRRSQSRAAACVRFSPVAFALWRRHARAGPAPRRARRSSAPRGAETFGTCLPVSRTITATSSSPVRPSRRHAARTSAALLHTCAAPFWPDASLEVLSPSALAGPRCAVRSGHAANDPASAFAHLLTARASADLPSAGVALAVFRRANAMRCELDARMDVACGAPFRRSDAPRERGR